MLLAALPYLVNTYEVLVQGSADLGTHVAVKGDDWGYYARLFKNIAFLLFFVWLATFGVKEREK